MSDVIPSSTFLLYLQLICFARLVFKIFGKQMLNLFFVVYYRHVVILAADGDEAVSCYLPCTESRCDML